MEASTGGRRMIDTGMAFLLLKIPLIDIDEHCFDIGHSLASLFARNINISLGSGLHFVVIVRSVRSCHEFRARQAQRPRYDFGRAVKISGMKASTSASRSTYCSTSE